MTTQNKNSGTEDELGLLHNGICKILSLQQRAILKLIEEEDIDALVAVDPKVMAYMMGWVIKNEIGYAPSQVEEQSLHKMQMIDVRDKATKQLLRLRMKK